MFVVDAFVVNVAIPSIRRDLGATAGEMEGVIAVYQIAYATMVITGGRLGDIFGRRRLFIPGVLSFAVASIDLLAKPETLMFLGFLADAPAGYL